MNRSLKIELGAMMNLIDRASNADSSRSIALAKRTFKRSKVYKERLIKYLSDPDNEDKLDDLLAKYVIIQNAESIDVNSLMMLSKELLELLQ